MKKLTLKDFQQIAEDHGGKCLSTEYLGSHHKLLWECSNGHWWEAVAYSAKRGYWCRECNKNTIEKMRKIASERGGKCLSEKYVHSRSKLKWKCSVGHEWEAHCNSITDGCWCPFCAGRGKAIGDLHVAAKSHGGRCLSTVFKTVADHYVWECAKGHRFETSFRTVQSGCWCSKCAGFGRTIDDMRSIAQQRDGACLSKKYTNVSTSLKWKCSKGHIWETTPKTILNGSWCPVCRNVSEQKCRKVLEKLSGKKFPATKKVFGNGYELDMYNGELELAFEFDGIQHYKFIPYWHKTQDRFEAQQKRDRKKNDLCEKNGIILERIHYSLVQDESELEAFIREKLIKHKISLKGEHSATAS